MRAGGLRQIMLGLNGALEYLGTIDASTSGKSQGTASSTFTIPSGAIVLLQSDASAYFVQTLTSDGKLTASGSAQTTAAMLQLDVAPSGFYTVMTDGRQYLWVRSASGTANVKVFQVR